MENKIFNEVKSAHMKMLKQYVPIVARVHGQNHPEFHEVHQLFDAINQKIKAAGSKRPDLTEEFARLRDVTDSYTIPSDVCESYEAVYTMLSELDKAYGV
ncbi:MAG: iron-sulfur cluster repair di-iron protein, ric [Christensenellales bacterium]|jgi:iron-sulfur cluster repair protein YtfE (RIC family)